MKIQKYTLSARYVQKKKMVAVLTLEFRKYYLAEVLRPPASPQSRALCKCERQR